MAYILYCTKYISILIKAQVKGHLYLLFIFIGMYTLCKMYILHSFTYKMSYLCIVLVIKNPYFLCVKIIFFFFIYTANNLDYLHEKFLIYIFWLRFRFWVHNLLLNLCSRVVNSHFFVVKIWCKIFVLKLSGKQSFCF